MLNFSDLKNKSKTFEAQDVLSRYTLDASFELHSWLDIKNLVSQLEKISVRDNFEFTIELDGSDKTITSCTPSELNKLEIHYNEYNGDNTTLTLELKINKNFIEQTYSIYNLKLFADFLSSQSILKSIELLSRNMREQLIFEVFEEINNFGSKTIKFIRHGENISKIEAQMQQKRNKKIASFKEGTTLIGLPYNFTAADFDFSMQENTSSKLIKFFQNSKLIYALAYLSNSTEVNTRGEIQFKFNGYRSFSTVAQQPEGLKENNKIVFKIYSWVFSDGPSTDKLGLVRNIFTLNSQDGKLNLTINTWHTIQSNYEIYLKENVTQYLELKGKLLEFISEFNKRALDSTDGFISSFQNSTVAFISFIVSVVVINGLKDAGSEKIFSKEYFLISIFICVASTFWLYFSRKDTQDRIVYITKQTKNSILSNYKNILSEEELNSSIDPVIFSVDIHTGERIRKYTVLWVLTIVSFFLVFSIGVGISKSDIEKSSPKNDLVTPPPAKDQSKKTILPKTNLLST
ncbi:MULTISPECIES: hypothetical protein [unclassified Pseudomonas]|uniref:hypothetical protein n=1 Tax=unclassified Pseudomonas TaxID=196821 RepID=UPI000F58D928|nr:MULTISPECIES: hypothetical protein [unclassified Pseudomonas]AZF40466.1 hypothetical protein C4J87_0275 [Pseudomonas sp. R1-43-08]AZF56186.1 hypothetical protein C4J84_0277 [Pseudomonas sp. R11-23-07]